VFILLLQPFSPQAAICGAAAAATTNAYATATATNAAICGGAAAIAMLLELLMPADWPAAGIPADDDSTKCCAAAPIQPYPLASAVGA
jgi:hypothetical protein